jgi:hypothetical protein
MTRQAVLAELNHIAQRPPTREERCLNIHNANRKAAEVARRVAAALRSRNTGRGIRPRPGLLLPPY